MAVFKLEFNVTHAVADDLDREIEWMLTEVARKVIRNGIAPNEPRAIYDYNGNNVGMYELHTEADQPRS